MRGYSSSSINWDQKYPSKYSKLKRKWVGVGMMSLPGCTCLWVTKACKGLLSTQWWPIAYVFHVIAKCKSSPIPLIWNYFCNMQLYLNVNWNHHPVLQELKTGIPIEEFRPHRYISAPSPPLSALQLLAFWFFFYISIIPWYLCLVSCTCQKRFLKRKKSYKPKSGERGGGGSEPHVPIWTDPSLTAWYEVTLGHGEKRG